MSDAWNLDLDDGVLTVELRAGIESTEFERLYDGIVREISAVEAVLIDVGGIQMTNTGSQLLDSLVAQLEARGLTVTVLRRP
jgi:hypothetical protein